MKIDSDTAISTHTERTATHTASIAAPRPAEPPHETPESHAEPRARYLVLFGRDDAPRAVLFDMHERLLAEMVEDDDGYIMASLLRASRVCAPPRRAMIDALEAIDRDADLAGARCFQLA